MYFQDLKSNHDAFSHFWYAARRGWLRSRLSRYGLSGRRILEIGCGGGSQLDVLSSDNDARGCDVDADALAYAESRGHHVFQCDICRAAPEGAPYEVVCMFDVLEHLDDPQAAVSHAAAAMSDGAMLMVSVPAYQFLFSDHDRLVGHVRRYSRKAIVSLLSDNGFAVTEAYYWNSVLFPAVAVSRLLGRDRKSGDTLRQPPPWLNRILFSVLSVDNWLVSHRLPLPFGLSIFVIAERRSHA